MTSIRVRLFFDKAIFSLLIKDLLDFKSKKIRVILYQKEVHEPGGQAVLYKKSSHAPSRKIELCARYFIQDSDGS